jgi:hypothetical protein
MRRRGAWLLLLLAGLAAYGWLDVRHRARVDRGPRHHRTDFTVYQAAAKALRDGTDPYEAENPRGYRYAYPPLLAVLLMPLADVAPPNAALVFYAVSMAALLGALVLLSRLPHPVRDGPLGPRPVLAGLLVALPFLHQSFERGQVTVLLLSLEVAATALAVRGRFLASGLALAVGGALRLTPLLLAGAIVLGLVAARRLAPAARFSAGLLAGLLLCFAVIPAAALGGARALEVTAQWRDAARRYYGAEPGRLEAFPNVNEHRFKNQSPRRVLTTWTGWASGASFDRERPDLPPETFAALDRVAYGISLAFLLLAAGLGWRRLRDPDARAFAATALLVAFLPVLVTRYAWPTHYVAALPVAAFAFAGRRSRAVRSGLAAFVAGEALFYAAHLEALEPIGQAGVLLLGALALVTALVLVPPSPEPAP